MNEKRLIDFEDREYLYFQQLENKTTRKLDPSKYTVIRCDGSNFHTFTRFFLKPFDPILHFCLDQAYYKTVREMFGNTWAYIYSQSDEVTIVLAPLLQKGKSEYVEIPFSSRDKIISKVPSRIATTFHTNLMLFIEDFNVGELPKEVMILLDTLIGKTSTLLLLEDGLKLKYPIQLLGEPLAFDARLFQTDKLEEVHRCLTWRRCDAINNLKQMWAQSIYSPNFLKCKKINDVIQLIKKEYKKDWTIQPTLAKRGCFVRNAQRLEVPHEFHDADELTQQYEKYILSDYL